MGDFRLGSLKTDWDKFSEELFKVVDSVVGEFELKFYEMTENEKWAVFFVLFAKFLLFMDLVEVLSDMVSIEKLKMQFYNFLLNEKDSIEKIILEIRDKKRGVSN